MNKKYYIGCAAAVAVLIAIFLSGQRPGGGGFSVREFSPQNEASRSAEVRCLFSRAAVSDDIVGAPLAPDEYPLSFSPEISGFGRWTAPDTFVLTPSGGLPAASRFSASVREGLKDLNGAALSGVREFSFNTPPLEFLGAKQVDFSAEEKSVNFEAAFSLPVDAARFAGYARIIGDKGRSVDFSAARTDDAKKILLTLRGISEEEVTLNIAEGLTSEAGPLGLSKACSVKLKCTPVVEIRDSYAFSDMDGGRIIIETTAPVDLAKAPAFIGISPKKDFSVEPTAGGFAVSGAFAPQDRVTVEIKKGLPCAGRPETVLENDWSRAFIFPNMEAQMRFSDDGRMISPSGSLRLPVESVNIDKISVTVRELYPNNIAYAMRAYDDADPRGLAHLVAEREYAVHGRPNVPVRRALDLAPLLGRKRGVFLITAVGKSSRDFFPINCVVNVSDLGLSVTMSDKEALVRVLSVSGGKPVPGVEISLLSWENQIMGRGRSNAEGVARIAVNRPDESSLPAIAVASIGGDCAYLRFDNGIYGGSDDYDTSGAEWLKKGYSAYCYTPRDIFRPGDTVPVMAVLRGADGKAPAPFPVTVKLYGPGVREWGSQSVMLTKEGTAFAEFELTAEAPVGSWYAAVIAPGRKMPVGFRDLYVEDFAAPRMFVEAESNKKSITADESCDIDLSGRYTFGTPAAAMHYEAELSTQEHLFTHKDWKGFSFRDEDTDFVSESAFISSGVLDAEGHAGFKVTGADRISRTALDMALRCGVMDDSGRWTYKTITIPWYPSESIAGIEVRREVSPQQELSFRAAAVKPDGSAAEAAELNYALFRRVSRSVTFESGGRGARNTVKELIPRGNGTVKLSGGTGAASVNIKEAGEYVLRVETPDGKSRASAVLYAYGAGGADTQLPDVALITMDKKIYKVGDTAKIKVKSPFAGCVTISAGTTGILWSAVRQMNGLETEFSVPVTENMKPNAWVTAQIVRASQADGASVRAAGAAPLMVDNSPSRLAVEIAESKKLRRGKNSITLYVRDAEGRGREADVTVMAVDETILGLTGYTTPAPWEYFTSRRALATETYDVYGCLITPDRVSEALRTAGGGAGEDSFMKSSLSPVQARRFRLLSLAVKARSDSSGRCETELEVPEFSGAVRLMAVAATAGAEGSCARLVQAGGDIVTELSLPRFAADGDRFTSSARIFNNAERDVSVRFSLKIENSQAGLNTDDKLTASLNIKKGESAVLPFSFTAKGTGIVNVICETETEGAAEKIRQITELPVRPAAPRVTENHSAVVAPGKSLSFKVPDDSHKAAYAEARVMLSAAPSVSLSALAEFLITYPYGCIEQTVSSAWPLLVQPELVKDIDPALADKAALLRRVDKIVRSQNYDGGFPRWSGEGRSYPWESLYAAHFLFEARRMGVNVAKETLSSAADYVRLLLTAMPEDDSDEAWRAVLTRRAYAAFVLTLAGEPPLGWMESIRSRAGDMEPAGRLLLACAYAAAGEKGEARKIIGEKGVPLKEMPGRDENYGSALRDEALGLLASVYIDPASPDAAARADALLKLLAERANCSTQEGGFAVAALGRWIEARPREGKPAGLLTGAEGKQASVDENQRSARLSGVGSYTVENKGQAQLYASWSLSYIPEGSVPAKDNGISIRQKITTRSGKDITDNVEQGESLTAEVTVAPRAGKLRAVAAVLPLPAGLEIENQRLSDAAATPAGVRCEARDDRLILFIEELEKPLTWRYSLRAVTPGTFTVPQIYAECMYDGGISSVNGGGRITVNDSK